MAEPEAHAYTDGASTGSRGPGGYGAVVSWRGKTEEISGGEQDTTNLRMELTAACLALETIDEGYVVTVYSDASYLVNCMRRGWHERWRENGWLNHRKRPVANRDLWERLLEATRGATGRCAGGRSRGTRRPAERTNMATTGPTRWPWPPRGGSVLTKSTVWVHPGSRRPRDLPGEPRGNGSDRAFGRLPVSRLASKM